MSRAEAPILQKIRDKFDVVNQNSNTNPDSSKINVAYIDSSNEGYNIVSYSNRRDGFQISVLSEGGIFANRGPEAVQIFQSNFPASYLAARYYESIEFRPEVTSFFAESRILTPGDKGFNVPGDEGFELFEELHEKAQSVKPVWENIVELARPIEPKSFAFYERVEQGVDDEYIDGKFVDRWIKEREFIVDIRQEMSNLSNNRVEFILAEPTRFSSTRFKAKDMAVREGDVSEGDMFETGGAIIWSEEYDKPQVKDIPGNELRVFGQVYKAIEGLYRPQQ